MRTTLLINLSLAFCAGACDTTLAQRDHARASIVTELGKSGYARVREDADTVFPPGGAGGWPSIGLSYNLSSNPMSYKMHSERDVIVWIGCSPPKGAWYFGCTEYLNSFGGPRGSRHHPFGSMGDSLNQLNMNTTSTEFWDSTFVVITTADARAAADVTRALEEHSPRFARATNIQVLTSQLRPDIKLSDDADGATFTTGCRLAPGNVEDWDPSAQDAAAAWMTQFEPLVFMDGSERREATEPFPTPLLTPRRTGMQAEMDLQGAFHELQCQVKRRAFDLGFVLARTQNETSLAPMQPAGRDYYLNGTQCILEGGNCIQDAPDALYTIASVEASEMHVLVGVNHRLSRMATYGYMAIDNEQAVHDRASEGSATPWAPHLNVSDQFIVLSIRRDLQTCDDLPADMRQWCFATATRAINYAERAYLNPITHTGPDAAELLPTVVLRFEKGTVNSQRPICASNSAPASSGVALLV